MPKGLHRLPFVGAEVDEDYLARYLTLANIPIEQTIFRNMQSPALRLRAQRAA